MFTYVSSTTLGSCNVSVMDVHHECVDLVLYGNGLVMVNFRWKKDFFKLFPLRVMFEIFGTMSSAAMPVPPLKVRFLVSCCVSELVAKCLPILNLN